MQYRVNMTVTKNCVPQMSTRTQHVTSQVATSETILGQTYTSKRPRGLLIPDRIGNPKLMVFAHPQRFRDRFRGAPATDFSRREHQDIVLLSTRVDAVLTEVPQTVLLHCERRSGRQLKQPATRATHRMPCTAANPPAQGA